MNGDTEQVDLVVIVRDRAGGVGSHELAGKGLLALAELLARELYDDDHPHDRDDGADLDVTADRVGNGLEVTARGTIPKGLAES